MSSLLALVVFSVGFASGGAAERMGASMLTAESEPETTAVYVGGPNWGCVQAWNGEFNCNFECREVKK